MSDTDTYFDAKCANCGQPQSKHTPDIRGENMQVVMVCPKE